MLRREPPRHPERKEGYPYIPTLVPWEVYTPRVYTPLHTLGTPRLLPASVARSRTAAGERANRANPGSCRTVRCWQTSYRHHHPFHCWTFPPPVSLLDLPELNPTLFPMVGEPSAQSGARLSIRSLREWSTSVCVLSARFCQEYGNQAGICAGPSASLNHPFHCPPMRNTRNPASR